MKTLILKTYCLMVHIALFGTACVHATPHFYTCAPPNEQCEKSDEPHPVHWQTGQLSVNAAAQKAGPRCIDP